MLNSLGESCYEGVKLLAALVGAARSTSLPDVCAVADTVSYEGARGLLHLHDRHLDQPVYLSVANGLEFDVLAQLERRRPRRRGRTPPVVGQDDQLCRGPPDDFGGRGAVL